MILAEETTAKIIGDEGAGPEDNEDIDDAAEIRPPNHDSMIEAFKTLSNYLRTNDEPINYYEVSDKLEFDYHQKKTFKHSPIKNR